MTIPNKNTSNLSKTRSGDNLFRNPFGVTGHLGIYPWNSLEPTSGRSEADQAHDEPIAVGLLGEVHHQGSSRVASARILSCYTSGAYLTRSNSHSIFCILFDAFGFGYDWNSQFQFYV